MSTPGADFQKLVHLLVIKVHLCCSCYERSLFPHPTRALSAGAVCRPIRASSCPALTAISHQMAVGSCDRGQGCTQTRKEVLLMVFPTAGGFAPAVTGRHNMQHHVTPLKQQLKHCCLLGGQQGLVGGLGAWSRGAWQFQSPYCSC